MRYALIIAATVLGMADAAASGCGQAHNGTAGAGAAGGLGGAGGPGGFARGCFAIGGVNNPARINGAQHVTGGGAQANGGNGGGAD